MFRAVCVLISLIMAVMLFFYGVWTVALFSLVVAVFLCITRNAYN